MVVSVHTAVAAGPTGVNRLIADMKTEKETNVLNSTMFRKKLVIDPLFIFVWVLNSKNLNFPSCSAVPCDL